MTRPAKGVTLIELLVVISIVGVLIALLLPAVQAAREAARRSRCQNQVRQIGLALLNRQQSHRALPPGWVSHARNGDPGWGWAAILLPFIEQSALKDTAAGNFGRRVGPGGLPIGHASNRRFRETTIPLFLCPSDSAEDPFMLHRGNGPSRPPMFEVAPSNYLAVFGTNTIEANPNDGNGVFFQNSSIRTVDILDGLSNTLMVGERCSRLGNSTWVGAVPGAGQSKARVVGRAGNVPNHVLNDFADFSSYHPFGAYFVLCDGATKLISDQIDSAVFRALATRSGKEITVSIP